MLALAPDVVAVEATPSLLDLRSAGCLGMAKPHAEWCVLGHCPTSFFFDRLQVKLQLEGP